MARHYEIVCCREEAIRKLLPQTIESTPSGVNWWSSGREPQAIEKGAADRMQREKDMGVTARSQEPLEQAELVAV